LSSKTKKAKPARKKKEAATKAPKVEGRKIAKPTGRVPGAVVSARHDFSMVDRPGKGFSRRELSDGGLPLGLALKWGVPVDLRRRSMIQANVAAVKKWYAQPRKAEGVAPPKTQQPTTRTRAPKKKEA
jgi:ribosomal protein L13E